ncbi:insulin induced protein 2 [Turdus rufiventris]|nr:insulin induced protein 2 [Turdus rufiventris]
MAENDATPTLPKKCGPYISSVTSRGMNLVIRGVVLFFIGVFLALVLNLLQIQRNVTLFPPDVITSIFSSAWWVPPCCGTASGGIFLEAGFNQIEKLTILSINLKPGSAAENRDLVKKVIISSTLISIHASSSTVHKNGAKSSVLVLLNLLIPRTSVMYCLYFLLDSFPDYFLFSCCQFCTLPDLPTQKVDFANNIQLSLTLAALSIGLWWTFDRSRSGFGLGVGIAFLATLVSQLLVYNGVYQYTSPDFLYVRSWLPCIFFAGGITMGNIGRQLAMYECKVIAEKSHED